MIFSFGGLSPLSTMLIIEGTTPLFLALSLPKTQSIWLAISTESEHDGRMIAIGLLFVRMLCDCFKSRRVDWSLVTIMGNTPPPRDPNDDDDEDEGEEGEEDEDQDEEPPVVREPDE